jgi:dephospho-CoA kinase
MKRVGVTGGIGSGKSHVCKAFECLGIPVFYADSEVKKMYDDTPEVHAQLIAAFGKEVYDKEILNRQLLAQKVFGNSQALATLNQIAHPAVGKRFLAWCEQQKNAPYVLHEAALLFESNAHRLVDKVIAVTAPTGLRIQRVLRRDRCTRTEVEQRMAHQLSDKERTLRADYTITCDDATPLLPQILKIHEELLYAN